MPTTATRAPRCPSSAHSRRLPTDQQWVKAARGGTHLNGKPNPAPARLRPWGPDSAPTCVNEKGKQDGYEWVAPVDAFACGASPYGILNLAGNVQEWIAQEGQPEGNSTLRVMRGGAVDSPPELEHTTTVFINHRDPRSFDYSIGFRCVSGGDTGVK
jgi:formylglycine-generating enzyme required for sulfatase activity